MRNERIRGTAEGGISKKVQERGLRWCGHVTTVSPTVSVFYHLGGVDICHHDRPAFSVSGHLWVNVVDGQVNPQSV